MTHRLGIIGAGNMGGAIVRGCIRAGAYAASEVIVADVDASKLDDLRGLGIEVTHDASLAARSANIILAVKPQVFGDVARLIAPLPQSTVVISIMAGLNSRWIRTALGATARVIRVMPNMTIW